MPEDRSTNRPRDESDGVNRECLEGAGQGDPIAERTAWRKRARLQHYREKIIPFDSGADSRGNDGPPELPLVFGL
jgi:hypothetical protein